MINIISVTNHHQFDGIELHSDKDFKKFLEVLMMSKFTFILTYERDGIKSTLNSWTSDSHKRIYDFVDGVTNSL